MAQMLIAVSYLFLRAVLSSSALRLVMLDVPSPTSKGESVELTCSYDLDNDKLYSIKWYKNDIEFYRYVPNDWPPGQFLPLPGVRVDLSKSGVRSVYLRHVDLNSAGLYRCEVSAEAPSFQTVEAEREMNVFVLPTEGPRITGGKPKYHANDNVDVNCTSAKSKPAATLRWFINDNLFALRGSHESNAPYSGLDEYENKKIGSEYDTEYSTTLHADGLETSSLSLRFQATEHHFKDGNMKLKCTATISRVYTMSNEEMFPGGSQLWSPLTILENDSREKSVENKKAPGQEETNQVIDSAAERAIPVHSILLFNFLFFTLCIS